jgi:preprotein translocase subunit SecD
MINFPRWKIILVLVICVWGVLYASPNITGGQWAQENLPGWLPNKTINLGLDLQGGSHLLLDVDVESVFKERVSALGDGVKAALREKRIRYVGYKEAKEGISLKLRDVSEIETARKQARGVETGLIVDADEETGVLSVRYDEIALEEIAKQTMSQSIEIVRRRVDETGTKEPVIQRQGEDRIVLQLPGLDDPARIKELLGRTAKLSFHLVDNETTQLGRPRPGTKLLPHQEQDGLMVGIKRRANITGDMLTNASPSFQFGQPVVSFRLNGLGSKRFCDVSSDNVGKLFAIVLDDEVISSPVFREPICGGSAQISGSFTVEEANDLAILLRAGALPAPLQVVEERTVGPSLGADSVAAGEKAALYAIIFVLLFMAISYGRLGIYANGALIINICLIFAVLSTLQATLTLPGIAGIVLTIGMAVDANVLIFERIREEYLNGRTLMSAVDSGYKQAMSTIIDANVTTLIAAILLYSFGTGPIKGFAVTLAIGIVTSMFSAIMVTRLFVARWLKTKRPTELPI